MLNVGWGEMGLVLLVALVVFGPNRLPEVARSMGKFVRQFQRETSRAMSDLKEGLGPVNVGIFDEPDAVAADPVGAGSVEPVADAPATRSRNATRQLAPTRRKMSTPPARRAKSTRSRKASTSRASTKKSAAKRSTAQRPARRASGASKSRRRA